MSSFQIIIIGIQCNIGLSIQKMTKRNWYIDPENDKAQYWYMQRSF